MDDLLKSVAQLDGHDLSIYSTRTVTVKPAKKPKEPQGYKRRPPKPVVLTPADLNSFDYDDFVSKFSTVCEADVAFARLDPESMSSHIKKIKRDERYGKIIIIIIFLYQFRDGNTRFKEDQLAGIILQKRALYRKPFSSQN